jgi:hypothetical protein
MLLLDDVKTFLMMFFIAVVVGSIYPAFAHKTITVEQYEIDVGWRDEPPLVNQQNAITFVITEGDEIKSGVTNAFKNLDATVSSGSMTKTLDILSDVKAGHYFAKIIPTKTGTLTIILQGTINDIPVDERVTIEDVESTDILAFPPTGSVQTQEISALKNAMSSLQKDIIEIKSKASNVGIGTNTDLSKSYDLAMFAMSIGAAGVILAVISMIKRK